MWSAGRGSHGSHTARPAPPSWPPPPPAGSWGAVGGPWCFILLLALWSAGGQGSMVEGQLAGRGTTCAPPPSPGSLSAVQAGLWRPKQQLCSVRLFVVCTWPLMVYVPLVHGMTSVVHVRYTHAALYTVCITYHEGYKVHVSPGGTTVVQECS